MKLGRFSRAALVLTAPLLSVVAAAQVSPGTRGLNIPDTIQFVGKQDPSVRKATAIVNGEVITETDIDHRVALRLQGYQGPIPAEDMQRLRVQVFGELVDQVLQIGAAREQEIEIEDREVEQIYAATARENNRTPEELTAYLRSVGSSERALKRQIRGEVAWDRLQRRMIAPFVSVGDEEVQEIINQLTAARGTAEYRVAEIFISATPETAAEARANAARIVQQIRGGAAFEGYARQFSEASTAARGGDLGWVRADRLPSELATLVTQMPVGALSDPIEVPGGFSIVYLADSRQILVADPRNAVMSLMQLSIDLPPGTTADQAQARAAQLQTTAQSMGGCGRARETAASIGAELIANELPVRELPPALQEMLLGLNVGQATPPFGTLETVSVLVLCGRDDPEEAGTPSFDRVYDRINRERVARRAERYIRDLRRDAIIDYR